MKIFEMSGGTAFWSIVFCAASALETLLTFGYFGILIIITTIPIMMFSKSMVIKTLAAGAFMGPILVLLISLCGMYFKLFAP